MAREMTRDRVHHLLLDGSGIRAARPEEFADWVQGHLSQGRGTQDYSFIPNGMNRIYVATRDLELPALHGALAINLIVPAGVEVKYSDLGDNRLFLMKDYAATAQDIRIPPAVAAELSRRGVFAEEFIYAEAEALAREMGHRRSADAATVEHTLGLISAGMQHVIRPYIVHAPEQQRKRKA